MADITGFRRGPIRYELRLQGHLDQHWSIWFTGLTLTQNPDGTTSLCGTPEDQAELHGLLTKVRDLGATLLSVTSIASVQGCAHCTDPAAATADLPDESESDPAAGAGGSVPPCHTRPGE